MEHSLIGSKDHRHLIRSRRKPIGFGSPVGPIHKDLVPKQYSL